jgi:hypothetical protein
MILRIKLVRHVHGRRVSPDCHVLFAFPARRSQPVHGSVSAPACQLRPAHAGYACCAASTAAYQAHYSSSVSLRNVSLSERSLLTTSCRSSTVGSSSRIDAGNSVCPESSTLCPSSTCTPAFPSHGLIKAGTSSAPKNEAGHLPTFLDLGTKLQYPVDFTFGGHRIQFRAGLTVYNVLNHFQFPRRPAVRCITELRHLLQLHRPALSHRWRLQLLSLPDVNQALRNCPSPLVTGMLGLGGHRPRKC